MKKKRFFILHMCNSHASDHKIFRVSGRIPEKQISEHMSNDIPPHMINLNTVIPNYKTFKNCALNSTNVFQCFNDFYIINGPTG